MVPPSGVWVQTSPFGSLPQTRGDDGDPKPGSVNIGTWRREA